MLTSRAGYLNINREENERMRNFFYSRYMLYLLAALLMLVFFLPDIIGPLPALAIGSVVIAISFFVYNKWEKNDSDEEDRQE